MDINPTSEADAKPRHTTNVKTEGAESPSLASIPARAKTSVEREVNSQSAAHSSSSCPPFGPTAVPAATQADGAQIVPKDEDTQASIKLETDVDFPQEQEPLSLKNLERLISAESSDTLEAAVQSGLEILDSLSMPLTDTKDVEKAPGWLETIEKLRALSKPTRTVVAVVGGTGAGKSSTSKLPLLPFHGPSPV